MTFPGNIGYAAPMDPITALVRRIEDLERTQLQMNSRLVDAGNIRVVDPSSGNTVFYVGPSEIPDGSGRVQSIVDLLRDDGTPALGLGDGGTVPGHTHQQALQWFDRGSNVVVADDTTSGQGLARPYIPIGSFTSPAVPTDTTTSTTFTTLQTLVGYKQHPRVAGQVLVYADVGTTGTIQITDQASNVLFTTNLTSGQFNYVTFGPVALAGTHELAISLNIQGKVLTGAGKVGARGVSAVGVQS